MAGNNRSGMKDSTIRSKSHAPAKAYAIRAREDTATPDVTVGTFSLFIVNVYALIDSGLTHSYICITLVLVKKILAESTEFVVKVTNSLGQYVLVDNMCKNFPLKI